MKTFENIYSLIPMDLQLFGAGDNTQTGSGDLSPEMKTYYSDFLIDNAEPNLVHDQFAQRQPIPKGNGKIVEFRKYSSLDKLTNPLSEGVTPTGQSLKVSSVNATVYQYGGYVEISDILLLAAIDNNMVQTTKLLGSQAGRTLDTISREVINGGTNVQYGESAVAGRYLLAGGEASGNHYLTVDCVKRAVRYLKMQNSEKIDGSFCCIVHPDVAYDLTNDSEWVDVKTYSTPEGIYEGEIGKLFGVRFVESTEAKVFHAADLTAAARNLTVKTTLSAAGTTVAVKEAVTAADAAALVNRKVLLGTGVYTVASASAAAAGSATVTMTASVTIADGTADKIMYPGEAGAKGRDVYSTLVLGANAYGVTEIEGGGLEHIVKQLGSGGTSDPLNQRATVGWKATKAAIRLVEEYMVRIETTSTFEAGAN